MDRYRVVQHLVRYQGQDRPGLLFKEPCKSQGARVRAGAGFDRYRVVQHLVRYHVRARRSD